MWTIYTVRWEFLTKLCASVPANPDRIMNWLQSRQPRVRPPGGKSTLQINEEVFTHLPDEVDVEKKMEKVLLIFQRERKVCTERAATIKAHLKDCASQLDKLYRGKIVGELTLYNRVCNGLYVVEAPYWIPILRPNGSPVSKPDGILEKRVPSRYGGSALKGFEYIQPARMEFQVKILTPSGEKRPVRVRKKNEQGKFEWKEEMREPTSCHAVVESDLSLLFQYGGVHGYAGERGDGEGKYLFTVLKIEEASHA